MLVTLRFASVRTFSPVQFGGPREILISGCAHLVRSRPIADLPGDFHAQNGFFPPIASVVHHGHTSGVSF
jgi:hypothetical protein